MNQNRRNFLKASGVIAGGALLNPVAGKGLNHSVDDVIRVALIGCGGRGTGAAAQALSTTQNVQIVAMADAFQDRLDGSYKNLTAKKYTNAAGAPVDIKTKVNVPDHNKFVGFDAYKKAIALKEVDVVILATPPGFRPWHFEEAVKNNKQIFMEKPVATDAPGIRKVLEVAEEAKRKKLNVVVGLQRHYQANYREAIKRIQDGAIGDIVGGQVYWVGSSPWMRERKPEYTEMEYQMRNWYYFNWLCGDHISEQHVHNIDVANWIKGSYPVEIQGTGGREVRDGKEYGEIFDHHLLDMVYADGTVISSQCRQFQGTWNRVDEAFVGTKGRIDSFDSKRTVLKDYKGNALYSHNGKNDKNPYQVEHDELFAAIAKGEYKYADAENAAKSTMTAIMGRMATYSGKLIKWDEALNSKINLFPDTLAWDAMPKIVPDSEGFYPVAIPGKTQVI
ncbi:secreted protein [Dyadobacter jejuensis]|uniref:Secreted protein n=1 Tax=Dyadobacter jejuensis TaxID=1082580 RepID=A0A316ARA8_9BACT|nr:Gfo/Idh/MocA family oxidoreductase [Dyadobacter jejuensis]PWJ59971.1 secreted protein [Dyadobacter jejuensis]